MEEEGLYIQLFSIHGLIRGNQPELGRDADTGGQVLYVLELARHLGRQPGVARVDLVTRYIEDKSVSSDYARPIEELGDKARIVRIGCGGKKYIRKEKLWSYLDEMVDKTLKFIKKEGRIPDVFHGHYPDGGYVAMELADSFKAPFIFTGHSLGRNKKAKLLNEGMEEAEINRQYRMDTRIGVEEEIIASASLIIASTRQEIEDQYGLYDNYRKGSYTVIPPGIDIDKFFPYYNYELNPNEMDDEARQTRVALLHEFQRFWNNPDKPFILALSRPDQRKNISGLIEAYGKDKELQALANLAVFAGIRQDIEQMKENERQVLTKMLLKMDYFDLYGKLAIPKKHDFATEVPELYRLCAASRGVFVNPALVEPFGITLVEASSCGLPIVATDDGGPRDIVGNCENGVLVDSGKPEEIAAAIKRILVEPETWELYSNNGIKGAHRHYSWQAHCESTLKKVADLLPEKGLSNDSRPAGTEDQAPFGKRLTGIQRLLITDIDNTLLGERSNLDQLLELLDKNRSTLAWGVATGRSLELTIEVMTEHDIPIPDIFICSVGTAIYYGPDLRIDKGWQQHISLQWYPDRIKEVLSDLPFLVPQAAEGQRRFKISYLMEDRTEYLQEVKKRLKEAKLSCEIIYSHGQFLDILPRRASKGRAIKYLQYKWNIPADHVMVAGDSGNDEDMLRSGPCAVVVGNHSEELNHLEGRRKIYFSKREYAAGIIDGLRHFGFI